jgi:arginine decarboxylase
LRQASVILIADPQFNTANLTFRFDQAYKSFTTTSPSAPIVASCDIAKRQMLVEGDELIAKACGAAAEFKRSIAEGEKSFKNPVFEVERQESGYLQDPTKVTLWHNTSLRGVVVKRCLWERERIQINKYSQRTVMLMFMPGFSAAKLANLAIGIGRMRDYLIQGKLVRKQEEEVIRGDGEQMTFYERETNRLQKYPQSVFEGRKIDFGYFMSEGAALGDFYGEEDVKEDEVFVSCGFVTPYPPGYPVIFPGQVLSKETLGKMRNLDGEVHGRNGRKLFGYRLRAESDEVGELAPAERRAS